MSRARHLRAPSGAEITITRGTRYVEVCYDRITIGGWEDRLNHPMPDDAVDAANEAAARLRRRVPNRRDISRCGPILWWFTATKDRESDVIDAVISADGGDLTALRALV